jgi:hypothetical protein
MDMHEGWDKQIRSQRREIWKKTQSGSLPDEKPYLNFLLSSSKCSDDVQRSSLIDLLFLQGVDGI